MDDKEVQKRIRLVDTASFTLGVFMAMWVEYLILAAPSAFPWFYLVCLHPISSPIIKSKFEKKKKNITKYYSTLAKVSYNC
jgi:hypothetical protein